MLKFNPDKLNAGVCYFPQATGKQVIVVVCEGRAYAYENLCPHMSTPLNMIHDNIAVKKGKYLVCSNHGAIFEADSGKCVGGPCAGASLKAVDFQIEAD